MIDSGLLAAIGFVLILAGLIAVFIAIVLLFFPRANHKDKVKGGGVIIIGLLPIVFGTDRKSVKMLLILSIVLMAFVLLANIALNYSQ